MRINSLITEKVGFPRNNIGSKTPFFGFLLISYFFLQKPASPYICKFFFNYHLHYLAQYLNNKKQTVNTAVRK